MGATCRFCDDRFRNRQAVKAHLRTCEAYRKRQRIGSEPQAGSLRQKPSDGLDPAEPVMQEVRREEARLKLRQVRAAHRELDAQEAERQRKAREKAEAARQEALERQEEDRRGQEEARARQRREQHEEMGRLLRRARMQEVKSRVVEGWRSIGLPQEVKARMLLAIERELADVPVHEMPLAEVITIAEGARDQILAARDRSVEKACRYAQGELQENTSLPDWKRSSVLQRVEQELKAQLTGEESPEQIEDLVDGLLERELGRI